MSIGHDFYSIYWCKYTTYLSVIEMFMRIICTFYELFYSRKVELRNIYST